MLVIVHLVYLIIIIIYLFIYYLESLISSIYSNIFIHIYSNIIYTYTLRVGYWVWKTVLYSTVSSATVQRTQFSIWLFKMADFIAACVYCYQRLWNMKEPECETLRTMTEVIFLTQLKEPVAHSAGSFTKLTSKPCPPFRLIEHTM